jgi:protein-tyrosine-phosphatase
VTATQPFNVLFLCTGNSARSVLAEALLDRIGGGRFRAFSAGSHPKGAVHPATLELLRERGYDVRDLRSKSWDEFARPGAPPLDVVVTVCDRAGAESCPVWPTRAGRTPARVHWSIDDPAEVSTPGDEQRRAFRRAYDELERRIREMVALSDEALRAPDLGARLERT